MIVTRAVHGILSKTLRQLRPYTIEEAYEVADAIERNDLDALKDELGDLLLQVVFHSQMASNLALSIARRREWHLR